MGLDGLSAAETIPVRGAVPWEAAWSVWPSLPSRLRYRQVRVRLRVGLRVVSGKTDGELRSEQCE